MVDFKFLGAAGVGRFGSLFYTVILYRSSMSPRGAFILFEGVDRCGKTTQAKRLVERLNASGRPAVFMNFPDRSTTIGKQINAYLANTEELDDRAVHLLFSANRWEKR
jgi:dTMP kinase